MPRILGNPERERDRDRDRPRGHQGRGDRGPNRRHNGDHVNNFKAMAILRPGSPNPAVASKPSEPIAVPKLLVRNAPATCPQEPPKAVTTTAETSTVPKPPPDTDWMKNPKATKKSCKILTSSLEVNDKFSEHLLEQTDFLVVGVVGFEGVGKSTIVDLLTGSSFFSSFGKRTKKTMPTTAAGTRGVTGTVTPDRIVMLDFEPFLSSSALFDRVWGAKGASSSSAGAYRADYGSKRGQDIGMGPSGGSGLVETAMDIQSLQLASLALAICDVIVVVQDRNLDSSVLRFLQAADMLRIQRAVMVIEDNLNPNQQGREPLKWVGPHGQRWFRPHVVFVHNRCEPEDFTPARLKFYHDTYSMLLRGSDLRTHTGFSMASCFPYLTCGEKENSFNLFLIPETRGASHDKDPRYDQFGKVHPTYKEAMQALRTALWSTPRFPLAEQCITEKTWFTIVSRTWDAVRRSGNFIEYSKQLHLS